MLGSLSFASVVISLSLENQNMNQRLKSALSVGVFLSALVGALMFYRARRANQPEELLKRMTQAYKNCASYQDTGTVKMTLGGGPSKEILQPSTSNQTGFVSSLRENFLARRTSLSFGGTERK